MVTRLAAVAGAAALAVIAVPAVLAVLWPATPAAADPGVQMFKHAAKTNAALWPWPD